MLIFPCASSCAGVVFGIIWSGGCGSKGIFISKERDGSHENCFVRGVKDSKSHFSE